jgi:hypothetical protein
MSKGSDVFLTFIDFLKPALQTSKVQSSYGGSRGKER